MINNKNSGLSILEALVSTAIVGIGFIAILQMTNFSVQSIDNSGERTKANFITTMIVEDVIGNRNTFYKKKADEMGAPNAANPKFSEHLAGNAWSAENCVKSTEGTDDQEDVDATKDIYKDLSKKNFLFFLLYVFYKISSVYYFNFNQKKLSIFRKNFIKIYLKFLNLDKFEKFSSSSRTLNCLVNRGSNSSTEAINFLKKFKIKNKNCLNLENIILDEIN